jgi:hypothetical protein
MHVHARIDGFENDVDDGDKLSKKRVAFARCTNNATDNGAPAAVAAATDCRVRAAAQGASCSIHDDGRDCVNYDDNGAINVDGSECTINNNNNNSSGRCRVVSREKEEVSVEEKENEKDKDMFADRRRPRVRKAFPPLLVRLLGVFGDVVVVSVVVFVDVDVVVVSVVVVVVIVGGGCGGGDNVIGGSDGSDDVVVDVVVFVFVVVVVVVVVVVAVVVCNYLTFFE